MKKRILLLSVLFSLVFFLNHTQAAIIESFDSKIVINPDASIWVEEDIVANTMSQALHGIYRVLPEKYRANGSSFTLPVENFTAQDKSGSFYPVKIERDSGNVRFRIGDARATFTGRQEYILRYSIPKAINYFSDHDELYWNITGDKWEWPILQASAKIILPGGVEPSKTQIACYQGSSGSKRPCNIANNNVSGNFVEFASGNLEKGEGLTVVVGFPKNLVANVQRQNAPDYDYILGQWIWLLVALCFAVCFWRWWQYGRDPQTKSIVIAQYDPPQNLSPLQADFILHERVAPKAMTAEFVWLAVLGYLRIKRIEEKNFWGKSVDYEFEDLQKDGESLDKKSEEVLNQIRGQKFSAIKTEARNSDYSKNSIAKIFQAGADKMGVEKFFSKKAENNKNRQLAIGVFALSGCFIGVATKTISGQLFFGCLFSGLIIVLFGFLMSRRTEEGVEMKKYFEGLKLYMSVAEKDRLAFHNAPEKTPEHFDMLLPWAILLGVEKQWIKQFEGIYNREPHWYVGGYYGAHGFSFDGLSHDLSSFSSDLNSGFSSGSSGLGGGGSSGGGGGGGGGGGW